MEANIKEILNGMLGLIDKNKPYKIITKCIGIKSNNYECQKCDYSMTCKYDTETINKLRILIKKLK